MLNDEQVKEFQRYLVYNHAAGIGEPAPIEHVRAAPEFIPEHGQARLTKPISVLEIPQQIPCFVFNDEHHIMIGIILALAVQFISEYLRRAHTGNCMPPRGIFIYFSDER